MKEEGNPGLSLFSVVSRAKMESGQGVRKASAVAAEAAAEEVQCQ